MNSYYLSLVFAFVLGFLTFIPTASIVFYLFKRKGKKIPHVASSDALEEEKDEITSQQNQFYKVGWLNVTREQHLASKNTSIGNIVKSYLSGNSGTNNNANEDNNSSIKDQHHSATYFAVLKFNILYLYDSELQLDCKTIINISHYTVQIYPPGLKDYEIFSKVNRIQLKKRKHLLDGVIEKDYFINTSRCVDKEDWYVVLKRASKLLNISYGEPAIKDLQSSLYNSTHFDQDAMNHLISTIHSDPSHFESQWLNALLGRIFLGIYKTETTKSFFRNKILSKIAKLNARRPPFLEEITVRSVDGGHGSPYITQPRLIHLSPQGEYTSDAHVFYDGHFRVELETVLTWKYSDRLPPIRIDLVLAITLKSIEGKMMFKIKEPPTNRAWLGFYKKPKMEWIVEPLVWEKRMGYSMVSKAIQTKIEEIIAETMVLPNMDDMVFFQTEGVGGIYGEEDNFGKSKTTAFNLDGNKNKNKGLEDIAEEEKNPITSNISSLSYQSLPELYSSPSELVISTEPFPLLSTSISSTVAATPAKKSWFKRKKSITTTDNPMLLDDTSDTSLDTPSQQTLKSIITPIIENKQANKVKLKRKKSTSVTLHGNNRPQFLATNVDHSIQSLLINKSVANGAPAETPTVQSSSSSPSKLTNNNDANTTTTTTSTAVNALHSVRLSKKMLLLVDHQPSSRSRSKSLPSTGLSIDVAQMKNKQN